MSENDEISWLRTKVDELQSALEEERQTSACLRRQVHDLTQRLQQTQREAEKVVRSVSRDPRFLRG